MHEQKPDKGEIMHMGERGWDFGRGRAGEKHILEFRYEKINELKIIAGSTWS